MFKFENTTLFTSIEIALNKALAQQQSLLQDCAAMQGQYIGLHLRDIQRTLVFAPHAQGLTVLAKPQLPEGAELAAVIEASIVSLARAALTPDQVGLPDGMQLSGDTELARQFSELLKAIDLDWEEHLAQRVGDVLAHQIGEGVRSLFSWGQSVGGSVTRDVAEYVREEAQQTPHPDEVAEFFDDVDDLRHAVERLEARLQNVQAALSPQDHSETSV